MAQELNEKVPSLTAEQMLEVDRLMIEDFEISLLQMMENAGRHLAELVRTRFFGGEARGQSVGVLAGGGGNGGGAVVAARRLFNWGAAVEVFLTKERDELKPATAHQVRIVEKLGIACHGPEDEVSAVAFDAVLDGMIGYSLQGRPRGVIAEWIRWANNQPSPTIALDLPTGLDATSGEQARATIKAAATLTLALPKTGLMVPGAELVTGELYLADISVPDAIFRKLGIEVGPLFSAADMIRLR